MSDQVIVERGGLEKKDKSELSAIVSALGGTPSSRARKADLIDQIIELSSESPPATLPLDDGAGGDSAAADDGGVTDAPEVVEPGVGSVDAAATADGTDGATVGGDEAGAASSEAGTSGSAAPDAGSEPEQEHPIGPDGEPLADWEVAMMDDSGQPSQKGSRGNGSGGGNNKGNRNNNNDDDVDPNNRRSRRRGRGRGRDRDDAGNDPISAEPVAVQGSLDLRDEGYGFLRVDGFLPSKEDVYVSVKQVRQFGLRKGDHLTGTSRPANRNEKNPGFHQIESVNGRPPEEGRNRPRFEDLTPLFPDERLVMEMREEPLNMTTRIIDLVAPIGKGQRGLIVSPPKAGKTTIMKDIARAIETNNPDVVLIMLLVDERPEEVTDIRRSLINGEVAASTFDRPPDEHCAVAELTIERAKRLVEAGEDVVMIVDGITRLARAYNLTAPQTGRAMSGGVDAGALYPAKRFFGAARNLEEGGSLTMLATALVETGSKMDDVIFEEFKGTGNMELRLDRRLAEKRIFPAIEVDGSSTRHEELLFERKELQQAWKLRRVLSAMGDEGNSAAGVEMLIDRLGTFKTNAEFLAEIGKAP
ncbi:MAG: transcription termination factor Rho [Actinomycetota bacterium]